MAFGGTMAIRVMKDNDFAATPFPGTTAGLQAAIDYLGGGKGEVRLGLGTLLTTTAIWIHQNCTLTGSGQGQTVIKRSTMANGDPINSGPVVVSGPYGANGTLFSSGAPGASIVIRDLTLDGNYSSFGAVTQSNLIPCGFETKYVDGVIVSRVTAQNCLADGFRHENCRNVSLSEISTDTCGQWSVVAARNGVNFIGDYAAAGAWGYNYSLNSANIKNTGDEAIQASNITLLSIVDVSVDGCDFVFECSPAGGTTAGTFTDWTISDITAINALDYFFAFNQGQATGYTLNDITISNCAMSGHATLHDGAVIYFPSVANFYVNRLSMSNCQFRNINSKDTSFHHWVDFQSPDSTGFGSIRLHGCSFYGKSGSVRTGLDVGINLRGQVSDCQFSDCLLKDVPGTGIRLNDTNASVQTLRDILVSNVMVDGANDWGIRVTAAGGSGTLTHLHFLNCIVKDTNKQTSGAGIQLYCDQAGATVSNVYIRGCRVYKTSGATLTYGLDMARSAGTMTAITVENCDFDNTQTGWITGGSGVTGIRFLDAHFKGSDVASATTMVLGRGDLFTITGATQIDAITPFISFDRRPITFVAGSTAAMSTGLGNLTTSGYWVPAAGDTITLRYDGASWREVSRSQAILAPPGTFTLHSGGTIASATNVTLTAGNYFIISGAVTINTLSTGENGRLIVLAFSSNPLVQDNGTAGGNLFLAGSVDFTTSANATLTLISNGSNWFEVSRSVN